MARFATIMSDAAMRGAVIVTAAVLCLPGVSMADSGAQDDSPAPYVLPQDEDALRALEQAQRRIVNTAQRQCTQSLGGINRSNNDPCIISAVEVGVDVSNDPALAAFHKSLPMSVRYDGDRPQDVWRAGLVEDSE